jgi:hypothetical protein
VARHKTGVVGQQEVRVLLSPSARAHAIGRLTWKVVKPRCHEGLIEVRTEVAGCEFGSLRIYFVDPAPSEFSLQYFTGVQNARRVPVRRLDVNGDHKDWINRTHKHRFDPENGHESAYIPNDIPAVPLGPTVATGVYRRVFEAFATECHVQLPNSYWSEP